MICAPMLNELHTPGYQEEFRLREMPNVHSMLVRAANFKRSVSGMTISIPAAVLMGELIS